VVVTIIALVWANSPWRSGYEAGLSTRSVRLAVRLGLGQNSARPKLALASGSAALPGIRLPFRFSSRDLFRIWGALSDATSESFLRPSCPPLSTQWCWQSPIVERICAGSYEVSVSDFTRRLVSAMYELATARVTGNSRHWWWSDLLRGKLTPIP
jgi:hypothetical protein